MFTVIVAQKKQNQNAGTINPGDLKKIRRESSRSPYKN
jgi:hypothetical protein